MRSDKGGTPRCKFRLVGNPRRDAIAEPGEGCSSQYGSRLLIRGGRGEDNGGEKGLCRIWGHVGDERKGRGAESRVKAAPSGTCFAPNGEKDKGKRESSSYQSLFRQSAPHHAWIRSPLTLP